MRLNGRLIISLLAFLPFPGITQKADFIVIKAACSASDTAILLSTSTPPPQDSIFATFWDLEGNGKFEKGDTIKKHVFNKSGFQPVGIQIITYSGKMDAVYREVPVVEVHADFIADDLCSNQPVQFSDQSTVLADNVYSYSWNFGDGSQGSNVKDPLHPYGISGSFNVRLIVLTYNACLDTVNKTILISSPPDMDIEFSGDTVFEQGDSVVVTVVGEFDSIFWSTGETSRSVTIRTSDNYFVQGYHQGCFNEIRFSVKVNEDKSVKVMTVFTPNNDGYNDTWQIINLPLVEPCEAEVYNRWGEKVFSSLIYSNDWDGSHNGKELPGDTYYYFVRCNDGKLLKGTVNIVK